jgi:hypothetical protein
MSKLRGVSLQQGGSNNASPLSKYQTDHGRTSKMPPMAPAPRDDGGMSTGVTSGNFSMSGMANIPNNAGPQGTQDVADSVSESFASPKSSMP